MTTRRENFNGVAFEHGVNARLWERAVDHMEVLGDQAVQTQAVAVAISSHNATLRVANVGERR